MVQLACRMSEEGQVVGVPKEQLLNSLPDRVWLEEVEDGDEETEAEEDSSNIFGQIKLDQDCDVSPSYAN